MARPRNRRSAKDAGTRFERAIADYLNQHIDDRIDRRARTGTKDRGDIAGLRHLGARIVIECKNTARTNLAGWMTEAETQRGNDDANTSLIIHKRHGKGRPEDQWVTTTLADLVALLTGNRDHLEDQEPAA